MDRKAEYLKGIKAARKVVGSLYNEAGRSVGEFEAFKDVLHLIEVQQRIYTSATEPMMMPRHPTPNTGDENDGGEMSGNCTGADE